MKNQFIFGKMFLNTFMNNSSKVNKERTVLSPFSDEKLISSYLSGSRKHGELLFERYKNYVARIIAGYFRDGETVRDLTQETFVKTFKSLRSFKGKATFKTWLTQIAINLCRDYKGSLFFRLQEAHVPLDDSDSETGSPFPLGNGKHNPERTLLHQERDALLRNAISSLPEDQKTVLMLHYQGLSYDEIAQVTETTTGTVGSRMFHARLKLRDSLKQYFED
jgi:RNA polymerase sigma-70 factor (ECF subfamily)